MNGNYSTTAKAERLSDSKTLEFQWKPMLIGYKSGLLRQRKIRNGTQ